MSRPTAKEIVLQMFQQKDFRESRAGRHAIGSMSPAADMVGMVTAFHTIYKMPILTAPVQNPMMISGDRLAMRRDLIEEEFKELNDAVYADDIVGVADALGDLLYVVIGMALELGIPIRHVFEEIHCSNLTKLDNDGEPMRRSDGKILKGPNYVPPNLERVLSLWRKDQA